MFGLLNSSIIKELPPLLRDPSLRFPRSSVLRTLTTIVLKKRTYSKLVGSIIDN